MIRVQPEAEAKPGHRLTRISADSPGEDCFQRGSHCWKQSSAIFFHRWQKTGKTANVYLMLEMTLLVSVEPPVLLTMTVVRLLLIRLS